jgi:hypothetical protein
LLHHRFLAPSIMRVRQPAGGLLYSSICVETRFCDGQALEFMVIDDPADAGSIKRIDPGNGAMGGR